MIKDVYSVKNTNAKGTNCETRIRVRNLNEERAALTNNFIQIATPSAGYIVLGGKRVYLNYKNSIDFGDYAILDTDAILETKTYDFNEKFGRDDDVVFADENEMRTLAQEQFDARGALPQMERVSKWIADEGVHEVSYNFNVTEVSKEETVEADDEEVVTDNDVTTLAEHAQRVIDTKHDKYPYQPHKEWRFHRSINAYVEYLNGDIDFDGMAANVTDDMRFNLPFMNERELTQFFGNRLADIVLNDDQVHVMSVA